MEVLDHDISPTTQNNNNMRHNNNNNKKNDNTTKNSTIDQSIPYYIHHVKNPGVVLVYPPLSENNYEYCNPSMKIALLSKNKIKFINDKLTTRQEDVPLSDTWERCDNIMLS